MIQWNILNLSICVKIVVKSRCDIMICIVETPIDGSIILPTLNICALVVKPNINKYSIGITTVIIACRLRNTCTVFY